MLTARPETADRYPGARAGPARGAVPPQAPAMPTSAALDLAPAEERLLLAARRLRLVHHLGDGRAVALATAALIAAGGDPTRVVDYLAGDLTGVAALRAGATPQGSSSTS